MNEVLRALFVAWHDPVSQRFFPIGRLAQLSCPNGQGRFEFVYIQAIEEAQRVGFLPFLSFPELHQVYRSDALFPMFANRLLSKSRPDYAEYIEQLGLPPATISPILILSRSSGRRATDTLELFPLPEFEPEFGYRTWFWAHGMRHIPESAHAEIASFDPGTLLDHRCDPRNPVESRAIELRSPRGQHVGYMPTYLLDDAHTLQESCAICQVYVERVNRPPAPIQQRLLCRLESCWPEDFVPYSTPRYQPVVPEAARVLAAPMEALE